MPENITDAQFEEKVIQRKGISIVDFWTPWCGTCLQMNPALEKFAEMNNGIVNVYKLDSEDNPKTSEKYKIRSVPTIIFFKDGEAIKTVNGAMSQSSLQEKLDEILSE